MLDKIKSVRKFFSLKTTRNWLVIFALFCGLLVAVSFPEKIQDKPVFTYWIMSIIAVVYLTQNESI